MGTSILLSTGVELRPIPLFATPDYMAGSDGRVYSKARAHRLNTVDGWRPLSTTPNDYGYSTADIRINGKVVRRGFHKLVCAAFHGLPPQESMQVRHLDGNPSNNLPGNLRWGTQYENWEDRRAHGRTRGGEEHPNAKFSNEDRRCIAWAVKKGLCSAKHAARVLGVASTTIDRIVEKSDLAAAVWCAEREG